MSTAMYWLNGAWVNLNATITDDQIKKINSNTAKSIDVLIAEKHTVSDAKTDAVKVDTAATKTTVATVNTEIANLKTEIANIKTAINGISTSVASSGGGRQLFVSNGTFTVPAGVYVIYINACASGGAGASGTTVFDSGYCTRPGAGGAAGQFVVDYPLYVTPGQAIDITVGWGNTVIAGYLTLTTAYIPGGMQGSGTGNSGVPGAPGAAGLTVGNYNGGPGGLGGTADGSWGGAGGGGGGAATPFGSGGAGGQGGGSSNNGTGGAGGQGVGYGGGGGGGGGAAFGNINGRPPGAGGAGRPGIVIIEW